MRLTMPRKPTRDLLWFTLFASPALLGLLIFTIGPMLASLYYSFTNYQLTALSSVPRFVGLANYQRMFSDPLVWQALGVTATYAVAGVPVRLLLQLLIAMLLNRGLRGTRIFRTLLYVPSATAGVALAMIWVLLLNPQFGLLNGVLGLIGVQGPSWLYSSRWVIPSFLLISLWQMGAGILINLAGLQGIPQELYDAAEVDGAGPPRRFWHITLPLMTPIIFFNLVSGIIANLQIFTQAYVMTNGGPGDASLFYVLYLYRNAFEYFDLGYASALAWFLFAIVLGLTLIVFLSSSRWVHYTAEN
jgi:multiple sugar transport system permease protein